MGVIANFVLPIGGLQTSLHGRQQRYHGAKCKRRSTWKCMNQTILPKTQRVQTEDGAILSVHIYDTSATSTTNDSNKRIVLLIHDFMTDKRLFCDLIKQSSMKDCLFIAPDLRGFGSSSAPRNSYSRSKDLLQIVNTISSTTNQIDVIGSGMGGAIALQLGLDEPKLTKSICVLSSGLPGHAWSNNSLLVDITSSRMAGRLLNAVDKSLVDAAVEQDATDIVKWKRKFISTNETWSNFLTKYSDTGDIVKGLLDMAKDYRGFHFLQEDLLIPDPFNGSPLIDHIDGLLCPVLVVVGSEDTIDFREIAYEIWERVPKRMDGIVRIENAGHFLTLETPNVVAKHVHHFWTVLAQSEIETEQ